jgi:hypothetical protein
MHYFFGGEWVAECRCAVLAQQRSQKRTGVDVFFEEKSASL